MKKDSEKYSDEIIEIEKNKTRISNIRKIRYYNMFGSGEKSHVAPVGKSHVAPVGKAKF